MAYTETTRTSYGQRVGNSFKGIGAGILMFLAGTVLLWWNEGRTVKTTRMLKEAQSKCVELEDITSVNPDFNGKLVHATGFADTKEILEDPEYGISVNAIQLSRDVEYYQWVEHAHSETKDKVGGAQETVTTYTYEKEWVSSPVNSNDFKDPDYRGLNSVKKEVEAWKHYASEVSFGAYKLNKSQIQSISGDEPIQSFYIGDETKAPEIGDVRVRFSCVRPADITVISQVKGNTFEAFTAKNGYTYSTVNMGILSADEVFTSDHQSNKFLAWILRLLGFLLVMFGLRNVFNFIETLLKVLPFLANIIGWGVNLVCGLIAFVWSLLNV